MSDAEKVQGPFATHDSLIRWTKNRDYHYVVDSGWLQKLTRALNAFLYGKVESIQTHHNVKDVHVSM